MKAVLASRSRCNGVCPYLLATMRVGLASVVRRNRATAEVKAKVRVIHPWRFDRDVDVCRRATAFATTSPVRVSR